MVTSTLPPLACPGVRAETAEVVRRRVDDRQDVRTTLEVPVGESLAVTARWPRIRRVTEIVNN